MLKIQNVSKIFNKGTVNEKVVFDSFDLNVNTGDFISIVGSNGAGKTTLFQLLTGGILPDDGDIQLFNESLNGVPEYKRSKWIGTVYQNPTVGTSPSLTIHQNLALACNKGQKFGLQFLEQKNQMETYKALVSSLELGLEEQLSTQVSLLSGGQRQALALLMATIVSPKLLLLDEHTAALDPKTSNKIMELTEKIINEHQITTLMITHNLNEALQYGNRLIMLHQGRIVLDIKGEEKKLLTKDSLLKLFEQRVDENAIDDELLFS